MLIKHVFENPKLEVINEKMDTMKNVDNDWIKILMKTMLVNRFVK